MRPAALAAALAGLLLAQCQTSNPDPAAQLPPATQSGANTFGCLLNGQVWKPSGNYGPSNFRLTYDPNYANGALQIKAYRFTGQNGNIYQIFTIGMSNVSSAGAFPFSSHSSNEIIYNDDGSKSPCNRYANSVNSAYQSGNLIITRLDLTAGVISGTFDFKLGQTGCDTVRVTQGRFDYKL